MTATPLDQRIRERTDTFIDRPQADGLTWEQRWQVQADAEASALFYLLGSLRGALAPAHRPLSKRQLAERIEHALDYALEKEREHVARLAEAATARTDRERPAAASGAPPC